MTSNNGTLLTPEAPPQIASAKKPQSSHPKNGVRELVETIVFVVILVLLLRSFVAEAFVIPTGSMAETLLGYRRFVTCPECGIEYPVNCSEEVDPQQGEPDPVKGCTCPNCRYHEQWNIGNQWVKKPPTWGSGDRVLVAKWPMQHFNRWDVVVFKYPKNPQQGWVPMNYIKRLIGLPGDTIGISNGDLFLCRQIDYGAKEAADAELDRWKSENMFTDAEVAKSAFRAGQFEILRKPPAQMLSMRRLVYDNDHHAKDLIGIIKPRWEATPGWQANNEKAPTEFVRTQDAAVESWITYQNWLVTHGNDMPKPHQPQSPEVIRNFMGYNYGDNRRVDKSGEDHFWVGDLMVECEVDVTSAAGEFALELSKGMERFQARFDLTTGQCRLIRVRKTSTEELAKQSTALRGSGKHRVRFANFDDRLVIWMDSEMPFGDGVDYVADRSGRADDPNNLQPASFGTLGACRIKVSHLKLYRDTYYTLARSSDSVTTMYVQPGHYLCMGDNSTQSSDGRDWGMVPERLMQGKALMVYFPFWPLAHRFGPIR